VWESLSKELGSVDETQANHNSIKMSRSGFELSFVLFNLIIFFLLSFLARKSYPLFGLVVLWGILSPILYGIFTFRMLELGFSGSNLIKSLLWGVAAGGATSLIGIFALDNFHVPRDLTRQLILGVPLWLFVVSPFQEFFFRGLIQSKLSIVYGEWVGLLTANLFFTAWHYVSPIIDLSAFPLVSTLGIASTFLAGLVYGYSFMRSGNILSPWLAHVISGIAFIVVGVMDFGVSYS
jgi:membrane protease YdiL (CAAX protease family)